MTQGLQHCFADSPYTLEVQPQVALHEPIAGQSALTLRPDLVLRRGETAVAVIDAKWKRLGGGPEPADLHQILAYATALGCSNVALVYPGRRHRSQHYPLVHGSVRLGLQTVRIRGQRHRRQRSLSRFARSLCGRHY